MLHPGSDALTRWLRGPQTLLYKLKDWHAQPMQYTASQKLEHIFAAQPKIGVTLV